MTVGSEEVLNCKYFDQTNWSKTVLLQSKMLFLVFKIRHNQRCRRQQCHGEIMRSLVRAKLRPAVCPGCLLAGVLRVGRGSGASHKGSRDVVKLDIELLELFSLSGQPSTVFEAVSHSSRNPENEHHVKSS